MMYKKVYSSNVRNGLLTVSAIIKNLNKETNKKAKNVDKMTKGLNFYKTVKNTSDNYL